MLKKYSIRVIGLDLKKDVIALCNRLSKKFGFENLTFLHGDIAGYEGVDQVDMVVTLHACDTATDYALAKAVKWGAKVILSVPCCQHEINKQIQNDLLSPVLQYGLLKERMSALLTDGIRGQLLEMSGYRTMTGQTMAFCVLAFSQMLRAFNQRSNTEPIWVRAEGVNPWLILSFVVSAILMACILFVPALQSAFQLTLLDGTQWLIVIGLSLMSILQVEIVKAIKKHIYK